MTQVNDLSRSLVSFEQNSSVTVVVEMSESGWLVAGQVPGLERQPLKLEPDPAALLSLMERWREEAVKAGRTIERIALAFEARRDGFWLARWLRARDIEVHVIHSTSVAVSREHPCEDRPVGHGDAHARVPGLAARRARALRDGCDPRARGRR
ncbi:hypothetical protein GCM10010869_25620 [Mesorhizobium tianshanense]|uniref:Transposase n=1 Tax=Mesorhizobium tianshanense TaxID=39844 RepID=A0A562MQU8_9HYPH|nr:hypothetical protein [Mesorhizobium tianshanense]TWI22294.1 transposase [Mesorhizobium tianshanense]GLS36970.1 hypothetical protein GCM10010869_25620 [Mesorhizobium tianshanense]